MFLYVLKKVAVLLEMALEKIFVLVVQKASSKDIFSVARIILNVRIYREVENAKCIWFASHSDFRDAIFVAEAFMDVHLFTGAGTASEARVPNEVEVAI